MAKVLVKFERLILALFFWLKFENNFTRIRFSREARLLISVGLIFVDQMRLASRTCIAMISSSINWIIQKDTNKGEIRSYLHINQHPQTMLLTTGARWLKLVTHFILNLLPKCSRLLITCSMCGGMMVTTAHPNSMRDTRGQELTRKSEIIPLRIVQTLQQSVGL